VRVEEAAIQEIRELFEQAVAAGRSRDYGKAVELLSRVVASTDQFPQALL
jgi:hypothetical protein